jgi:dTDP-4-dehydrorhamnose 3,5-epimerase
MQLKIQSQNFLKMNNDFKIKDLIEINLDFFQDRRGEIYTFWNNQEFDKDIFFNHDKFTYSHKNVFRGIHGDFESTKYATCVFGKVFYVLVDNREDSSTYKQFDIVTLSQEKKNAIVIPPGIGSGALTLSDYSVTAYKLSYPNHYPDTNKQFSFKWNDFDIEWPIENMIFSERDK